MKFDTLAGLRSEYSQGQRQLSVAKFNNATRKKAYMLLTKFWMISEMGEEM
jgi:hypothetical protein